MSDRHPLRSPEAGSGLPASVRGFFFFCGEIQEECRGPRVPGVPVGTTPCPADPFTVPRLPLPFASKMDSPLPLSGFLVIIIPHALQPCLLRAGCQATAWPAVAAAELDKASASLPESPPQAPQVAGRPPAPQAQAALCLAWGRGGAPGPRSCWPRSPSRLGLPGPRALSAALTPSQLFSPPWPRAARPGGLRGAAGMSGTRGYRPPSPTFSTEEGRHWHPVGSPALSYLPDCPLTNPN